MLPGLFVFISGKCARVWNWPILSKKPVGYSPWFWTWRILVTAGNRSILSETPFTCWKWISKFANVSVFHCVSCFRTLTTSTDSCAVCRLKWARNIEALTSRSFCVFPCHGWSHYSGRLVTRHVPPPIIWTRSGSIPAKFKLSSLETFQKLSRSLTWQQ